MTESPDVGKARQALADEKGMDPAHLKYLGWQDGFGLRSGAHLFNIMDPNRKDYGSTVAWSGGKTKTNGGTMSIWDEIVKRNIPHDHHESDLYIPVTPETIEIVKRSGRRATTFVSQTEPLKGGWWFEIPFAYEPWWERRMGRSAKPNPARGEPPVLSVMPVSEYNAEQRAKYHEDVSKWHHGTGEGFPFLGMYVFQDEDGEERTDGYVLKHKFGASWFATRREALREKTKREGRIGRRNPPGKGAVFVPTSEREIELREDEALFVRTPYGTVRLVVNPIEGDVSVQSRPSGIIRVISGS